MFPKKVQMFPKKVQMFPKKVQMFPKMFLIKEHQYYSILVINKKIYH